MLHSTRASPVTTAGCPHRLHSTLRDPVIVYHATYALSRPSSWLHLPPCPPPLQRDSSIVCRTSRYALPMINMHPLDEDW